MESKLQCPVCTLYLHVGMDLQTHLDTHPKDQVIKALVNLTMMTKSCNVPNTNNVPSKYAPIAENAFGQEVNQNIQFIPDTVPRRPQQVLFGYSCSTRVFRDVSTQQPLTSQKFIQTNALPTSHIVPAVNASLTHQQNQKLPQQPPPPYGSIVSKLTIERPVPTSSYKLRSHQVELNGERNDSLYLPEHSVVDEEETVCEENVDDYGNQTDQNIKYIEHGEEEYVEEDCENVDQMEQGECAAYENVDPLQESHLLRRPNSVIYMKDDEPIDAPHEIQSQKKCTEGLRVLSDVKLPTTVDILNLDCKFGESFKLDDVLRTRLRETERAPIKMDDVKKNNDGDQLVVGDGGNEFEMTKSVSEYKPVLKEDVRIETNVAKTIKTELVGEQQACQNTEQVSHF